jgi:LmbE family N-acetylglucosaminyl deacetylase
MEWIYLSPHFDDVVFSCGGLVREQTLGGNIVEIWTICGGGPPSGELSPLAKEIHQSWNAPDDVYLIRQKEDQQACDYLEAYSTHLRIPDAMYRKSLQTKKPYYTSEEDLFQGLHPEEDYLVYRLRQELIFRLPPDPVVIAPLGIGNHIDHQLTHQAAGGLDGPVYYYADYPYVREEEGARFLEELEESGAWTSKIFPISDQALEDWIEAGLCYQSQLGTFWETEADFKEDIRHRAESLGGVRLWRKIDGSDPGAG